MSDEPEARRLLVCGGRWYGADDWERARLKRVLDRAASRWRITTLIHGGCKRWHVKTRRYVGADFLAGEWALDWREYRIEVEVYEAEWRKIGIDGQPLKGGEIDFAAGSFRNGIMILNGRPDIGIAFKGGNGTADMVRRLRKAQVETFTIDFDVPEEPQGD